MGRKTKRNPFGGNPFGAPSLPFDLVMPDPFKGAKDYDVALGLTKDTGGFDTVQGTFDEFNTNPRGRTTRNGKSRKRKFSIERQARLHSGQAPLTPEEEFNHKGDKDIFGAPHNHGSY